MTDRSIEDVLREHGSGYNLLPPGAAPFDDMWKEIEAETAVHWNRSGSRRRLQASIALGLAACLLVGFALGRFTAGTKLPAAAVPANTLSSVAVSEEDALYALATSRYLLQTAALLQALPSGSSAAPKLDSAFVVRASDLLSTTRLLIDSPASAKPELRNLISDLEIILAQIVQLRRQPQRGELDLITHALHERELLPRIQTAVTMTGNN